MQHLATIDLFILKYAHWIDNLDMYLGPFTEAAQLSSSSAMNKAGLWSDVIQYGLLKGPFIALYLARTKDFGALANWIPREIFALGVPYGRIIEVLRNYEKTVNNYYGIK